MKKSGVEGTKRPPRQEEEFGWPAGERIPGRDIDTRCRRAIALGFADVEPGGPRDVEFGRDSRELSWMSWGLF